MGEIWSDKYELVSELGKGGMGSVHLARQLGPSGFDQLVVIKHIRQRFIDSTESVSMFLDEARLTARLVHPNIVQIYDMGQRDGAPYLVMEHVHGRTLGQILKEITRRRQQMPVQHALEICSMLCRGLHFAHTFVDEHGRAQEVVHRDIKPSNVMIGFSGSVKLIDFGVAKSSMSASSTADGMLKGTFAYMAPEQIKGEPLDGRADVFSLGILLYQMITAHHPFNPEDESRTILEAILDDVPAPLIQHRPQLMRAEEIEQIVARCLAKAPAERYSSARELQAELERGFRRFVGTMLDRRDISSFMDALFPGAQIFRLPETRPGFGSSADQLRDTEPAPAPIAAAAEPSAPSEAGSADPGTGALTARLTPHAPLAPLGTEELETTPHLPSAAELASHEPAPAMALSVVDDLDTGSPPAPAASRRLRALPLLLMALVALTFGVGLVWWFVREAPRSGLPHAAAAPDAAHGSDQAITAAAPDAARVDILQRRIARRADARQRRSSPRSRPARPSPKRDRRPGTPKDRVPSGRPDAAPPRAAPLLGTLHLSTQPASTISLGGQRGATLRLRKERGTVRIKGGGFNVRLTYQVQGGGLVASVSCEPWAIAYPSGMRPGRTPQHGVSIGRAARRIELRRPGGGELLLNVRFIP